MFVSQIPLSLIHPQMSRNFDSLSIFANFFNQKVSVIFATFLIKIYHPKKSDMGISMKFHAEMNWVDHTSFFLTVDRFSELGVFIFDGLNTINKIYLVYFNFINKWSRKIHINMLIVMTFTVFNLIIFFLQKYYNWNMNKPSWRAEYVFLY